MRFESNWLIRGQRNNGNKMQKLGKRNTYTPTDASQVCSSVVLSLNREETLSEHNLKTFSNSFDENLRQQTDGHKVKVFVLNKDGTPLMPCKPAKSRHLLEQKKAKVVKRKPFVIQLLWDCEENTQDINLGVDSGYSKVGFSATTENEEVMCGEFELRNDIRKKLQERAMYRRNKRNKLWYRPPRFNNRKREEGWLAPSIRHKLDTHLRLIENLKKWLPITKTIIEVADFDTQKMQNPELSGIEYQQGELQGYEVREYLLQKFNRTCAYCKKTNIPLQIEHIIPKSKGGSNRVSNLTISCRECNLKKGSQTAEEFGYPKIQKLAKQSLKSTAFMNVVRKRLAQQINAGETFGYITKYGRIVNNIDKSHVNDAFVIAGGTNQERCKPYFVTQTRRNNRQLQQNRKGQKLAIRKIRYKIQSGDIINYNNKKLICNGVFNLGKYVSFVKNIFNINYAKINEVRVLYYGKGIQL